MPKLPLALIAAICLLSLSIPAAASANQPLSTPETTESATQLDSPPNASPVPFEAPRFGIHPVGDYENRWFEVTLAAGASATLTAAIVNSGEVAVALRTYGTNAFNPPNGGFAAGAESDALTGPARWLVYPSTSLELQPNDSYEIDFSVSIPAGTPPGEYVVALVAQTAESMAIPGTENLRQIIRSTTSVEITVPGEMTSGFDLGAPVIAAAGAGWRLTVPLTNTGTARVRPEGLIVLTNPAGEEVVRSSVNMGSVYGGNTSSLQIDLPQQILADDYFLTIDLTDPSTGTTAAIDLVPVALAQVSAEVVPPFVIEQALVTANADPVQFANVAATITNSGQAIPTATVTLIVTRDGEEVERYPLAQNQALPQGNTEFSQRYVPIDGWLSGVYTFQLVIASVDSGSGTEAVLATIDISDQIVVS